MDEHPSGASLNYAEITDKDRTSVSGRFSIDGTEGTIRAEMRDEYPPSSPGRARVEITYGDHSFEAYASNGKTPIVRVYGEDWGDHVDGWSGEQISEDSLDDWADTAAAVEEAVGDVDVYSGTEVFKYGEDADGSSLSPEQRIEEYMGRDVKAGASSSRVQARTTQRADLEAVLAGVDPRLSALLETGAVGDAWDTFIDGYEDHDLSSL